MKRIDVLGTEWRICSVEEAGEDVVDLIGDSYCDIGKKRIIVNYADFVEESIERIIREEIVRAFIHESGFFYANQVEEIDVVARWLAFQRDKIHAAFVQAGVIESDMTKTVNAMTRLSKSIDAVRGETGTDDDSDDLLSVLEEIAEQDNHDAEGESDGET